MYKNNLYVLFYFYFTLKIAVSSFSWFILESNFYFTPWNLISDLDFYEVISNFINLYVDCYYYAIINCKSCTYMQNNDKILSYQFKNFSSFYLFLLFLFAFLFLLLLSKLNLLGERKCALCLPRICNKTAFVWHIGVKKVSNRLLFFLFM